MKSEKGHKGETKTAVKVPALINQKLLTYIRDLILSVRRQVAEAVNARLTRIDRARGFLKSAMLSEKWV